MNNWTTMSARSLWFIKWTNFDDKKRYSNTFYAVWLYFVNRLFSSSFLIFSYTGFQNLTSDWQIYSIWANQKACLKFHFEFNANCSRRQALTLSQMTNSINFGPYQTERVASFCRKFFKRVEKTVGKGEIAHDEQFLLFLQCFQKTCTAET